LPGPVTGGTSAPVLSAAFNLCSAALALAKAKPAATNVPTATRISFVMRFSLDDAIRLINESAAAFPAGL